MPAALKNLPLQNLSALQMAQAPANAPTTLASSLVEQLREAIMSGALAPGEKLRLDTLRGQYGVSLSPLREALSRLGSEGLVVIEDQRGYRVAPVSLADLEEITRLRCELELMALTESIRRGDDRWEEALVASFHTLRKLDRLGRDAPAKIERWEQVHRDFHRNLLNAAGMPVLLNFCMILHHLSDRYRRIFLSHGKPPRRDTSAEHGAIMQAALARDAEAACAHLRTNIERTGANVRKVLPR
jgi:GntR family carbon starvation induced transcriptional regulator